MPLAAAPAREHSAPPVTGFFQQKLPVWIILASFFLVTLPAAGALVYTNSHKLMFLYLWIFSATHFVVTFTIYLQSENLRHFTATRRNLMLFVVVPAAIFAIFYLVRVARIDPRFPTAALLFVSAVRILDFNHFNRQSFGVYQLFKARAGLRLTPLAKRLENAYFNSLSTMLFITYLAGGISPWIPRGIFTTIGGMAFAEPLAPLPTLKIAAIVCALVSITLLAAALAMLLKASPCQGLWEILTYIAFQTLSAVLAIAFLPLYATALAIHYAEYHVLMYPRVFHSRLDSTQPVDKWYQSLRGSRTKFYAVLILLAGIVTVLTTLSTVYGSSPNLSEPTPYLAFLAIFDGIFVCHYFIEMLIWRFSDPFFRQTVSTLYIASAK